MKCGAVARPRQREAFRGVDVIWFHLAVVLIFIGSKIFVADLLGWEKFPPALSLGATFAILAAGVVWSLVKTRAPASSALAGEGPDAR